MVITAMKKEWRADLCSAACVCDRDSQKIWVSLIVRCAVDAWYENQHPLRRAHHTHITQRPAPVRTHTLTLLEGQDWVKAGLP